MHAPSHKRKRGGRAEPTTAPRTIHLRALQQRYRQQENWPSSVTACRASFSTALAGYRALARSLRTVLQVLEYIPRQRAIGPRRLWAGTQACRHGPHRADLASPARIWRCRTGKPVISNHLGNESRFGRPDPAPARHHRAMNVILQATAGRSGPRGRQPVGGRVHPRMTSLPAGTANLLGMAIERDRHERSLKAALERQEVLLKEMSHRVKNSLMIVSSSFSCRPAPVATGPHPYLEEAAHRLSAVARAHDQLFKAPMSSAWTLESMSRRSARDLAQRCAVPSFAPTPSTTPRFPPTRHIAGLDRQRTRHNAAKYAYPDRPGGTIWSPCTHWRQAFDLRA